MLVSSCSAPGTTVGLVGGVRLGASVWLPAWLAAEFFLLASLFIACGLNLSPQG